MNKFKEFLAKYSISTHSIPVAFTFLVTAFYEVQAFHDNVIAVYNAFPKPAKSAVVTAIALITFYKNWQKPKS